MPDTGAFHFSQLFSELTDRRVSVSEATKPPSKDRQVLGSYEVVSAGYRIVLKADLALLGSLGGILVGLPDNIVKQRLAETAMDEMLRDAMHEVLNIASSVVTRDGRAVLKKMELDATRVQYAFNDLLDKAHYKTRFEVAIAGYTGGAMTLVTQC